MYSRSELFLGDLFRAFHVLAPDTEEDRQAIIELFGFSWSPGGVPLEPEAAHVLRLEPWSTTSVEEAEIQPPIAAEEGAARLATAGPPVDCALLREPVLDSLEPPRDARTIDQLFPRGPSVGLSGEDLLRPEWTRGVLALTLSVQVLQGPPDVDRVVRILAAGKSLRHLPRRPMPTTRNGLVLLVDMAESMAPFAKDAARLRKDIPRVMGTDGVKTLQFCGCPSFGAGAGPRSKWRPFTPPPPGTPVVLITDFGIGGPVDTADPARPADWLDFAEVNTRAGCSLIAFVPYPSARWPNYLQPAFRLVHWDRSTSVRTLRRLVIDAKTSEPSAVDGTPGKTQLRFLAKVLSLAVRLEPGLVRSARLEFLPNSDAAIEADLWFSPFVESQSPLGIVLDADIQASLRRELGVEPDLLERAWVVIEAFHSDAPPSIRLEEKLIKLALQKGPEAESEMVRLLTSALTSMAREGALDVARWAIRALERMPSFPDNSQASAMKSILHVGAMAHLGKLWEPSELHHAREFQGWLPWLLQGVDRTSIRVRLGEGSFEIGEITGDAHSLELARTNPLLVQLSWHDGTRPHVERVEFRPGSVVVLECRASNVEVLTSLGKKYRLLTDLSLLAKFTSLLELDLSKCTQVRDLSLLEGLTSLELLNLSGRDQISDLAPLARLTSLQHLNLSGCERLSSNLSPLAGLASLQWLNVSGCKGFGDLSPLAGLAGLQALVLCECERLSDLSPLAGLASLRALHLDGCPSVRRFAPLESLLPGLAEISLFGCKFDDIPSEICGERHGQNVLDKVRAHYADFRYGARYDAGQKIFFLGNSGVGKTQLCRRLCDLPFDPSVPTTHGIQLGEMTVDLDGFQEPVRLNLWDFGGQDIYHGSHALFLHGHAIFLLLWTPELEHQTAYQEGALSFWHRPLSYWLDNLRAFAGTDASVLIVQSQCDTRDKRILHPPALADDFPFHRFIEVSARSGLNLEILKESIKEAVRDRFDRTPPPSIGVGRLNVRDRLRQMLEEDQKLAPAERQHRLLERKDFDRICAETGGVSDSGAFLDFLHNNGVLFYRAGLFGDRIVLDQNWALEAIYAIFDREKIRRLLRGYGRFSRADLEALIWSNYTPEEQKVFLNMMESSGICFRLQKSSRDEWEYLAPELLPPWSDAQEQLLGRLREDLPAVEVEARYAFLHEGIARGYLSKVGQHAKDAAVYWKYGCWFYEQTTRSQVLIESQWDDAASQAGAGTIRLRAWGERGRQLIEPLMTELQRMPIGQPPEVTWYRGHSTLSIPPDVAMANSDVTTGLERLEISVRPTLPLGERNPEVFVSYAWGDDSSQEARKRTEVVDRLCETLGQHGWHILRDSNVLRSGDLISVFMKRIGLGDHVIVVLSDKYLRSPYCMTELYSIYQRSVGEKEDFLRRIIPLVLDDARFGTPEERVKYAKHWEARYLKLKSDLDHLSVEDFRLYKSMQKWHLDIVEMLTYVSDVLVPHGFDDIVKDDFAALRQMLQQRR